MLEYWIAFYRLEPWGDEWRQSARVASQVSQLGSLVGATKGLKITPLTEEQMMPLDKPSAGRRRKRKRFDPAANRRHMANAFGVPKEFQ